MVDLHLTLRFALLILSTQDIFLCSLIHKLIIVLLMSFSELLNNKFLQMDNINEVILCHNLSHNLNAKLIGNRAVAILLHCDEQCVKKLSAQRGLKIIWKSKRMNLRILVYFFIASYCLINIVCVFLILLVILSFIQNSKSKILNTFCKLALRWI